MLRKFTAVCAALLFAAIFNVDVVSAVTATKLWANSAEVSTTNPLPVSGTVTATPSGTQDINVQQVNGATVATGAGTASGAQRVELPTDGTGKVGLNAGTAIVGKVGIDQTTDGTTNKVSATQSTASNLKDEPAGNVADATTDSGNPIKTGGIYESTLPTYTTGQRGNLHIDNRGNLRVISTGVSYTGADGVSNSALAQSVQKSTDTTGALLAVAPWNFNGATWDRQFTCASTVAVTAAAGTTQIVALSGSTIVRVCSYSLSMAAAGVGTVKFVYGTGSSCGNGTTDISAAMPLAANQNMTASAANGSLLRGLAANALCLTVATNTVTGYVTYAQF